MTRKKFDPFDENFADNYACDYRDIADALKMHHASIQAEMNINRFPQPFIKFDGKNYWYLGDVRRYLKENPERHRK